MAPAERSQSPPDDVDAAISDSHGNNNVPENASIPKPKRLACMICRKRKLKCDGIRPSCGTCSRLGHSCTYDEQRRKSGPKRGYVKALEERLKQVETLLKTQDANHHPPAALSNRTAPNPLVQMASGNPSATASSGLGMSNPALGVSNDVDMEGWHMNNASSPQAGKEFNFNTNMQLPMNNASGDFTWEMIGLGLEEPLPPQETIDELHQIYFEKCHPSLPMIHKYRYLAAMNLAPAMRPPVCLRYAMWTMACVITDKFVDLRDLFYQRARKYLELDYMKGFGEHMISVAHCQTHILLASYEMRSMYFPRAWISTGSGVRLAQMIGLHRLDGAGLDVKQCLPPSKDWTEREERRRTFWQAFCQDRYASIGTGWPMTIDEKDILTNLPASDEAYDLSRPEQTGTLAEALGPSGASKISSFGSTVLMACFFGRNLVHLHRPDAEETDSDLNGPFWKRHRQMDNILLNTSLCLPPNLKLPNAISNYNAVFLNMSIHTSAICLHQAAIFKAEKNKLAASVSAESKVRCITAANEIASIMRNISHMDLTAMNPFISFCLYVGARVFVQYLKSRPDDGQSADSLKFLLSAMNALKRRNPLTESFLVQLDVDFEALLARIPKLRSAIPRPADSPDGLKIRSQTAPAGAVCDDPDGVKGILSYRNECLFMKTFGDNGEIPTQNDLVPPTTEGQALNPANGSSSYGQNWLNAEHPVQTLTPRSGSLHGPAGGATSGYGDSSGDGRDASGSPDGAFQGDPGTGSANGHISDIRGHLQPGQVNHSGANSFQASPSMQGQDGMMNGHEPTSANLFDASNAYVMQSGSGLGQQHEGYSVNSGWQNVPPQQDVPEMGDGVLRALMNMGPLDAMDLSTPWTDTAAGNMR